MKKIIALGLCSTLALTGLCACNNNNGEEDHGDRIRLDVAFYEAAMGKDYAEALIEEYEKVNPNVYIEPHYGRMDYEDGTLDVLMPSNEEDVYFLSANDYYTYVNKGLLYDMTDLVQEKVYDAQGNIAISETGEIDKTDKELSIVDTMVKGYDSIYQVNGKWYAIPNFSPVSGIWYDADLFAEKGYSVPNTYSELLALMNKMVGDSITPFCFAASSYAYIHTGVSNSIIASYEGKADYDLNLTFDGVDSTLGQIDSTNAYELQKQEGRKAALQFWYDLAHNTKYTTQATRNGQTHTQAQDEFLMGVFTREMVDKNAERAAMFLEHSFWEPESKNTAATLGKWNSKYGYKTRNIKFMPFPSFDAGHGVEAQTNAKTTINLSYARSMECISANTDKLEEAKDFVQFCNSRRGLALYYINSSTLRPYSFTLTDEEYNLCSSMAKSVYDVVRNENTELTTHGRGNDFLKKENDQFWMLYTEIKNGYVGYVPWSAFRNYTNLTVQTYFEGQYTYWKGKF